MKKTAACMILFSLFFLASAAQSPGQELSAQEIVKRSDDLMRGDSQSGPYLMKVITPSWERTLELMIFSLGRDHVFIRILSPAKEKNVTTLRVGNEMWNYLPQVERVIKIPPSMMLQSWMGSDFANDDLVKESSIVNDYTHKITGTEVIDGRKALVIELTPLPQAAVVWERRVMAIEEKTFIPLRDEFYGKNSKLIKVLTYSDIKQISDRLIPTRWEMVSMIKEAHRTVIEVNDKVVYNKPIDDSVFTLQNLKNTK